VIAQGKRGPNVVGSASTPSHSGITPEAAAAAAGGLVGAGATDNNVDGEQTAQQGSFEKSVAKKSQGKHGGQSTVF